MYVDIYGIVDKRLMNMIKDILFVLSFLVFMLGLMLIKTTDRRLSFCKQLIIAIWTEISIGAVLAFIMNIVQIPIMLSTMTAVYGICAVLLWIWLFMKREKRIQALEFVWSDLGSVVFCAIVWGFVFVKVFGLDLLISYNGSDSGRHFEFASGILNSHKLNGMYFAALYNSLFMEFLQPFLIRETMYKAFILSDASLNLLNLLMFYVLASEFIKTRFSRAAVLVVSIFYFFGWPIWSWVAGGFVYFGAGVTAYIYGCYMLNRFSKSNTKEIKKYYIMLILLSLFCITECYLLFAPIFMFTIVVYALYIAYRNKVTIKKVALGISAVVFIGFIVFAMIYWGYFKGSFETVFHSLRIDGGIHRELYKDFMFTLPINTYLCIEKYKQKQMDVLSLAIICQFLVVAFAFIANVCGVISDYYYFKLYYLGWALQFVGLVQAIDYFWHEKKQVIYYCILPILMVAVLEITGISQNIIYSVSGNKGIFSVISQSISYIKVLHDYRKESKEQLITVCKYINDNYSENVPFVSTLIDYGETPAAWYTAITGNGSYFIDTEGILEDNLTNMIKYFHESEYCYFVLTQDIDLYVEQREWFEQFEKVYEDGYYGIYKIEE